MANQQEVGQSSVVGEDSELLQGKIETLDLSATSGEAEEASEGGEVAAGGKGQDSGAAGAPEGDDDR